MPVASALALFTLVIGSPPKLDSLVAAVKRGDPVELDRVARRLGAGRLARALAEGSPDQRRAALEAAPRVDEAWTLLLPALRLAAASDAPTAQGALRAARRIAGQIASGAAANDEIPRDVLREVDRTLVRLARQQEAPPARRAEAIGILLILVPMVALPSHELIPLVDDGAPEVRQAATAAIGTDAEALSALGRLLEKEGAPRVAGSAAAVVCRRLPRARTAAWTRISQLATDGKVDPADAIEILGCLAGAGRDERAVVAQAARTHPNATVKAAAAQLARAGEPGSGAAVGPATRPGGPRKN